MSQSWFKKKVNALELYTIDVILGRRADTGAAVYGAFLQVLSWLFNGIAQARLWLYQNRILHDQPLGCLVVVVGNLTVGGTGKTPVVEKFAKALRDRGRKVAILSRGYKSKSAPFWKKWWFALTHTEEPPPKIVSDGERVLLDSDEAGDEPFMLARNLPGVIVLVDKNRVKAGAFAIKKFGCDTLVLDDGFQYLPLKGRLNLLLVDKTNPFGNGHMLPRGILREPIKHLKRASYVFLTKSNGQRDEELEALIKQHNPEADIIECAHRPQYLQKFGAAADAPDARVPLAFLKGRRVMAFSGIATPESFEKFLRDLGAKIVARERFLDHYRYVDEDFEALFRQAREEGAECLVTTEKDAVRIPEDYVCPLPLYYLRLEIDIIRGAADFDEAVGRICFPTSGVRAASES
ncbi:MAG TPA: tetraacyldisaccharide 4'-kinase [Opitutus sp.]|nr:tetraacyldisaccharide 4'-kinase [Opitutus sp.]